MTHENQNTGNPYGTSATFGTAVAAPGYGSVGPTQLNLGRAATWMFQSPQWMVNIFWLFVCGLLGTVVIGSLIAIGYQMEVIRRRSLGRDRDYPDFDPNRVADYMIRGLWPFLVYFISGMVITVTAVMIGAVIVCICVLPFANNQGDPPGIVIFIMVALLIVLFLAMMAAMVFVTGPMTLRAGLTNNLQEGFRMSWVKDFAKRMWGPLLLGLLYSIVMALVAEVVGSILCLVGLFFTMGWFQLFAADLAAQLYDIYLNRGGESIPMADE